MAAVLAESVAASLWEALVIRLQQCALRRHRATATPVAAGVTATSVSIVSRVVAAGADCGFHLIIYRKPLTMHQFSEV